MTHTNLPSYHILSLPTRLALAVSLALCCSAYANNPEEIINQQILLNEQRQAALNQSLMISPSVQVDALITKPIAKIDSVHADSHDDFPCFTINQIAYAPPDAKDKTDLGLFSFALTHGKDSVLGQ